MAISCHEGDWVKHPVRGPGRINRIIEGKYLLVSFLDGSAPAMLSLHEVALLDRSGQVKTTQRIKSGIEGVAPQIDDLLQSQSEREMQALKVLEALRTGVVPEASAHLYTVGRSQEISLVEEDLHAVREPGGAARVFLGDYGSGKTHMLDVVQSMALKENFLVARTVLDSSNVSPDKPQHVFQSLLLNLTYPDLPPCPGTGVLPLLRRAKGLMLNEQGGRTQLGLGWLGSSGKWFHGYLSPAMEYLWKLDAMVESSELAPEIIARASVLREQLSDWLQGHRTVSNVELDRELRECTGLKGRRLYALKDFSTLAHLYAYMLGGISCLARECGYSGLVIMLDEAEFYSVLSMHARSFADLLFGYYCAAALGYKGVNIDAEGGKRGGHSVHRKFPPVYNWPQSLYCVFALTEDPNGLQALNNILDEEHFCRLKAFSVDDFKRMCYVVDELYCLAYPGFKHGSNLYDPMGRAVYDGYHNGKFSTPRQILKFVVELLDFARLCPGSIREYVAEMREHIDA